MVAVFYSSDYVAADVEFPTTRKAGWIAESLTYRPIPGIVLESPEPLTEAEVSTAHDRSYVRAIKTGEPRYLAQSQGFHWDPAIWPMVLASNGGARAAALRALRDPMAGSLSSGLHHASRGSGNGYCTFNGVAIAVLAALSAGAGDVIILDLDAHCGGGTHSILCKNPHAWQLDVSVCSHDSYIPSENTTLDMVSNCMDYLPTVSRRLDDLADRSFGLCIYNAGMDPHEDCPIGGLAGISESLLREREELVFGWCRRRKIPIAFVMAGGYTGSNRMPISRLVDLHRLTLEAASR